MSSSPSNPIPPFHRWYVWSVLFLLLVAGTTAIGLRMAPYIAIKIGNRPVAMKVHPTPEAKIPDTWKSWFAGAEKSISIATGQLSSEALAIELDAAARRGVSVVLILPFSEYPEKNTGVRLWLTQKESPVALALDPSPFTGSMCIIDGRLALVTSQPLASTDTISHLGGFFASFTDPAVIQEIRQQLSTQVQRSQHQ